MRHVEARGRERTWHAAGVYPKLPTFLIIRTIQTSLSPSFDDQFWIMPEPDPPSIHHLLPHLLPPSFASSHCM